MMNEDDQTNDKHDQNLELLPYKKNVSFKWKKLELDNEYTFLTGGSLIFNLWDNNLDLSNKLHINNDLEIITNRVKTVSTLN